MIFCYFQRFTCILGPLCGSAGGMRDGNRPKTRPHSHFSSATHSAAGLVARATPACAPRWVEWTWVWMWSAAHCRLWRSEGNEKWKMLDFGAKRRVSGAVPGAGFPQKLRPHPLKIGFTPARCAPDRPGGGDSATGVSAPHTHMDEEEATGRACAGWYNRFQNSLKNLGDPIFGHFWGPKGESGHVDPVIYIFSICRTRTGRAWGVPHQTW